MGVCSGGGAVHSKLKGKAKRISFSLLSILLSLYFPLSHTQTYIYIYIYIYILKCICIMYILTFQVANSLFMHVSLNRKEKDYLFGIY